MGFTKVCTVDDLWEGEMEAYTVNGQEILLVCAGLFDQFNQREHDKALDAR